MGAFNAFDPTGVCDGGSGVMVGKFPVWGVVERPPGVEGGVLAMVSVAGICVAEEGGQNNLF